MLNTIDKGRSIAFFFKHLELLNFFFYLQKEKILFSVFVQYL